MRAYWRQWWLFALWCLVVFGELAALFVAPRAYDRPLVAAAAVLVAVTLVIAVRWIKQERRALRRFQAEYARGRQDPHRI